MNLFSRTSRVEELNAKLSIAKALSKVDGFMIDRKFIDVYKEYQDKFFSNTDDVCKRAIDSITKNEYELVVVEMAALQRSDKIGEHFLAQARRAINFGLNALIEETKKKAIMLGHDIDSEEIISILANLKKLQKATQFISEHLDAPEDIATCVTEVKTLIAERMSRFIQGVRALITVNNFYEANKKIDSITLTRNLLGVYCSENATREIDQLKDSQSDVVLKEVVAKYSEMDISKYTVYPPTDIFTKFGKVDNNPIYNQACTSIREAIEIKFREELDSAKSLEPLSTNNVHIKKFESAVKYLPKDMRESLEDELKHCKEDIAQLILDNDNSLTNVLENGDLKSIKATIEKYNESGSMKTYSNKCREFIVIRIRDVTAKIKKCLEDKHIAGALENVKIIHEYQLEFQHLVPDIKQPCLNVQKQIKNIFEEAYLCFLNRFVESNVSKVTKDTVETVESNFVRLFEFMKFSSKYRELTGLSEMLPDDFDEKIRTMHDKMTSHFGKCEEQYKEALKNLDISSLKNILEAAKQSNSLITKMKTCYSNYNTYDDSTNAVLKAITELTLFSQMLESINGRIGDLIDELMQQELINEETIGFSKQRDEFYKRLNEKCLILNKAKELSDYNMKLDARKAEQECLASLGKKIQSIHDSAQKTLEEFLRDKKLTRNDYVQFNMHYNNLISCKKEMKVMRFESISQIDVFEKKVGERIGAWKSMIEKAASIEIVATVLIKIKSASNNFPSFKVYIDEEIDAILTDMKNSSKDPTAFGKLGVLLNQDHTGIGQSIVAEHKAFQGYSLSLFNEKTRKHNIDYVLNYLKGDNYDKGQLRKRYDEFQKTYESLIKQYLKPNLKLDQVIATTKLLGGDVKQESTRIEWDAHIRNKVPQLAAHIFALWTLQNAHLYFEAAEEDKKENYLLQPHAAQVISIFRMLGIGDDKEELRNNLVQIGTGEGKSVTLGATASILALLGFDVCCACYSEYLSDRDYRSFLSLFTSLDIVSNVHYGTFNKLCEYIINEDGDIRQVVEQLISRDSNQAVENAKQAKRAKILLIDEVDVFFSRDFYGNVYTPSASLRDPTITALVNHLWTQRGARLTLNRVQQTQEYKNCCARFPKWVSLIQEAIKDMLADVTSFEAHKYEVKEDKIGYIEQDNIIFNAVYGYKTLFAYYLEHGRGKISHKSLDEKICITIRCGGFSYAETPRQFQFIMGVTGTLETLSEPENAIIKDVYRINKQTITPSVFGENNLVFTKKDDIKIETKDDYYNTIKREIDDRLRGKTEKRAVLVFLESEKNLSEFKASDALKPISDSVAFLTEQASPTEKETVIKRATGSGQVTLFTKTFGRGTDFICRDPAVASNGGIHVIQTFLSEEVSEEVQIQGRTARQGDYGSYGMIVLDKDLEKYHVERSDIQDVRDGKPVLARAFFKVTNTIGATDKYDSVYDLLHDRRKTFFKTQYEANTQYVEAARKRHEVGQKFLASLKSGNTDAVRQFLIEENKGVEGRSTSRTVCLMDATGSMSHLLQKSKNTVGVMFERAAGVLKEHGISADCFEIQFAVYRNYSCQENKILQHSPWETKPDNLRAFMNTINAEGGMGNEAIEIGLWHANLENVRENITQIILIGDAPPNTNAEVVHKRQHLGEDYWKGTKFAQPTHYANELAKVIPTKIPVHAFYVDNRAKQSFQQIASETGGRCQFLDINSKSGSDMLTNLVTEEILRNVGGSLKGTALVDAYRAKFAKSYT